jgi:hypothetical protein
MKITTQGPSGCKAIKVLCYSDNVYIDEARFWDPLKKIYGKARACTVKYGND